MNIDISTFNVPIGIGMSGITYGSEKYPLLALKRMTGSICDEAETEFERSVRIYDAYRLYTLCNETPIPYLKVPQFLSFTRNEDSCDLLIERVLPTRDEQLWHLSLSDTIPMKDRTYGLSFSGNSDGPLRGFFPSTSTLSAHLDDRLFLGDIVYRIGILDGILLFGAGYLPIDVEYVLDKEDNVTALDFGLVVPNTYDDAAINTYIDSLDTSIYYIPIDEYRTNFLAGLRSAYNCFSPNKDEFLTTLVDRIESMD